MCVFLCLKMKIQLKEIEKEATIVKGDWLWMHDLQMQFKGVTRSGLKSGHKNDLER